MCVFVCPSLPPAKTRQLTTKDVDFHGGKETALSTIQAPPAFSFGKQDRGAYHKAYLNKEMAKGLQLQTTKEVDFLPMQNALTLGTFSNANKSANSPRPTFSRSPRDGCVLLHGVSRYQPMMTQLGLQVPGPPIHWQGPPEDHCARHPEHEHRGAPRTWSAGGKSEADRPCFRVWNW